MFPAEFVNGLRESLGPERAERVLAGLAGEPAVSVRVNPFKLTLDSLRAHFGPLAGEGVAWASEEGFYLTGRPSFTLDPLFHAGAYYVQEASSMFAGVLFERALGGLGRRTGLRVLDLCAAPGGKTTQLLSHLDDSSLLVANEVVPARATVLAENVARWGCPNVAVTQSDPSAFTPLRGFFDVVVVDAPCSGEGMFRKDERAVAEWSPDNVRLCAARQRRILADVWPALASGGFLIYSTCTFNHFEDEDNAAWMADGLGGELLEQRHFYPGEDRGEGFYAALVRKEGMYAAGGVAAGASSSAPGLVTLEKGSLIKVFPAACVRDLARLEKALRVIASGTAVATRKGRDLVPEADYALSASLRQAVPAAEKGSASLRHVAPAAEKGSASLWHVAPVAEKGSLRNMPSATLRDLSFETVEISHEEALKFLSREPLVLPDAPRGYLLLTRKGLGLGFVKNLGTRTNSLLPATRRIRMTLPS